MRGPSIAALWIAWSLVGTVGCGGAAARDVVVAQAPVVDVAEPSAPECGARFEVVYEIDRSDGAPERTTIGCADGAAFVSIERWVFVPDAETSVETTTLPLDVETIVALRRIVTRERQLADCGPGLPGPLREIAARVGSGEVRGICTASTLDPRWEELVSGIERAIARARELDAAQPRPTREQWPFDGTDWTGELG